MHLVLDKEVNQRYERAEESRSQVLPVLDCRRVRRAEHDTANGPGQCRDQIADHENVVPVVIIGTRHVCPPTAGQGSKDSNSCNELGKGRVRTIRETVEEEDERESRAGANGDKDLEERSLGVSIANGGRNGREPFCGVSEVFVLDNLVVMERDSDNESTDEGGVCGDGVCVGNVLPGNLS